MSDANWRIGMVKVVGEHCLDFTSTVYSDLLRRMVPTLEQSDAVADLLKIPFVLTCAAALEAMLNDHLIAKAFDAYGEQAYRRNAEALVSMTLRGKLDFIVPFMTDNRFVFKSGSVSYQALTKLIKLRNDLVHTKSFFTSSAKWLADAETPELLPELREKLEKRSIRTITLDDCKMYSGAILSLDEDFFFLVEAGTIVPNSLVRYAL